MPPGSSGPVLQSKGEKEEDTAWNTRTRVETGLEKSTHGGGGIGGSESGDDETGRRDGEVVQAEIEGGEIGLAGGGFGEVEENGGVGVLGGGDQGV